MYSDSLFPGGSEVRTPVGEGHFSHLRGPISQLCNGYRVFYLGVKRREYGVDHPSQSSVYVKQRVDAYVYSLSVSSQQVVG